MRMFYLYIGNIAIARSSSSSSSAAAAAAAAVTSSSYTLMLVFARACILGVDGAGHQPGGRAALATESGIRHERVAARYTLLNAAMPTHILT